MKKLLLLTTAIFLAIQIQCFSACPSYQEFQAKNTYFQNEGLKGMSGNSNLERVLKVQEEQENYYKSILPGCIQYYETTPNPDCKRLSVLTTGYIMADKELQAKFKPNLDKMLNALAKYCSAEVEVTKIMIK